MARNEAPPLITELVLDGVDYLTWAGLAARGWSKKVAGRWVPSDRLHPRRGWRLWARVRIERWESILRFEGGNYTGRYSGQPAGPPPGWLPEEAAPVQWDAVLDQAAARVLPPPPPKAAPPSRVRL